MASDLGYPIILFDNRLAKSAEDKLSYFQSYWLEAKYRLGWPSLYAPQLEPGKVRLVWYTTVGNEGVRDYPLAKAIMVKELFDDLSEQGFRPMILGYSGQNPYPMIGGTAPEFEKKPNMPTSRKQDTYNMYSGHENQVPVHDRIMAIIDDAEKKEAKARGEEVKKSMGADVKEVDEAV